MLLTTHINAYITAHRLVRRAKRNLRKGGPCKASLNLRIPNSEFFQGHNDLVFQEYRNAIQLSLPSSEWSIHSYTKEVTTGKWFKWLPIKVYVLEVSRPRRSIERRYSHLRLVQ